MFERLDKIEIKYDELKKEVSCIDNSVDFSVVKEKMKEINNLEETVITYAKYKEMLSNIDFAKEMLTDEQMHEYAIEEISKLEKNKEELENKLKILLLPRDPNDDKNVIVEIRGAAGGDEANIFAGDLFRMYTKYAENQGWKIEVTHEVEGESGGYAQIEFMVKGENAYSKLKYESGSHRVQRVPETESQGRIHTSTATVLVVPESDDIDININANDLKIDVYHSSGAGGQSVNTTDSAVRITHLPTNTVVCCQNERSQLKNKEKAMTILKSRLYEQELQKQEQALGNERKNKIGTGDRSEKIRTYNYPQNRITDHRINYTSMNLDRFMEGNIEDLIENLINQNQLLQMESENA